MAKKKSINSKKVKGFKKVILKEERVKELLKESGIRMRASLYFLLHAFNLVATCLCVCGNFYYQESNEFTGLFVCRLCIVLGFIGLCIWGKKASLYAKYIRNLKKEFWYAEGKIFRKDSHSRLTNVMLSNGQTIQETMNCPKNCQEGDRVLVYRLDGFKEKDRKYYLTTIEL